MFVFLVEIHTVGQIHPTKPLLDAYRLVKVKGASDIQIKAHILFPESTRLFCSVP
jgi:hypothetical protein